MQEITIQEIMTTDVISVQASDLVSEVARAFREHTFHHLPIVDEDHCLVGIISRVDFERIKYGAGLFRNPKIDEYNDALFQSMRVKKIMTKDVVFLQPTDNIAFAYKIFKERSFRALPVIEKGRLVGMLTPLDVLDFYFQKVNV